MSTALKPAPEFAKNRKLPKRLVEKLCENGLIDGVEINNGQFYIPDEAVVPDYLSAKECSFVFEVSASSVTAWCRSGLIDGCKKDERGRWLIPLRTDFTAVQNLSIEKKDTPNANDSIDTKNNQLRNQIKEEIRYQKEKNEKEIERLENSKSLFGRSQKDQEALKGTENRISNLKYHNSWYESVLKRY